MSTTVRLNHMSLQVRNLDSSAEFYRDVLLLPELPCGAGKPNIRWFGLADGQSVHLIEGNLGQTFVTKATHFCIASSNFDSMVRHFTDKGVPFGNLAGDAGQQHRRADGVRAVYLQDPDGYWIEINEDY
jgi:lactoylglutathione lyase